MVAASASTLPSDDTVRRERAKERLYVIFQVGGWGFSLVLQLLFTLGGFTPRKDGSWDGLIFQVCVTTMVMALGLLVSHYGRLLIARWGWKDLGWRELLPRVIALSTVQAGVWVGVGFAWPYLILGFPWQLKISIGAMMLLVWFNGAVSLAGWHCVYFFYHLFDRLNRSEIERLRLASTVKEAELRALKSQVNPHFIFNSLNSLRALIDEDPARARQSVTQLANLLRYSLQSGQLETVPFEDELRVVNDYLALEQVRHEERLRLRLDIAPETLALPVPPMLLQTLVENAVKYGISTRAEGGEVAIIARCENGALRLQVTNPGELAHPATPARAASTGVGLRNAAERLRLLFGERASLQLRAESPLLVVAEAVLPLNLSRS
jgi:signal transduction histidine kinase